MPSSLREIEPPKHRTVDLERILHDGEEGPDGYRYKPDGSHETVFQHNNLSESAPSPHQLLFPIFSYDGASSSAAQSRSKSWLPFNQLRACIQNRPFHDQSTVPAVTRSPMPGAPKLCCCSSFTIWTTSSTPSRLHSPWIHPSSSLHVSSQSHAYSTPVCSSLRSAWHSHGICALCTAWYANESRTSRCLRSTSCRSTRPKNTTVFTSTIHAKRTTTASHSTIPAQQLCYIAGAPQLIQHVEFHVYYFWSQRSSRKWGRRSQTVLKLIQDLLHRPC